MAKKLSHPDEPSVDRLDLIQDKVQREFQTRFGQAPEVLAIAPGRVNLIGEHIDYNDGYVLPMAIERNVVIAAKVATDRSQRTASVYSINQQDSTTIPLGRSSKPTLTNWGRYLEGVAAGFADRGATVPAFDAVVGSNIPTGGGLSSSAALEVATATLLESLSGISLPPIEKAFLCQRAEHQYAGVPCGIMDQFSSVFGMPHELMLIDCVYQQMEPVSFESQEVSVLITNSNVRHDLSGGEYAQRRSQSEAALRKLNKESWREISLGDVESSREVLETFEAMRSRHIVGEIERTLLAADAFRAGNWTLAGSLMYASHDSLRDQYEVSCLELDILVELAKAIGDENGVYGARMTGGGFGGCIVSLVRTENIGAITEAIHDGYRAKTGINACSFVSRPAKGAHIIHRNQCG